MSLIDQYEAFLQKEQKKIDLFVEQTMHYGTGFVPNSPPHIFFKKVSLHILFWLLWFLFLFFVAFLDK